MKRQKQVQRGWVFGGDWCVRCVTGARPEGYEGCGVRNAVGAVLAAGLLAGGRLGSWAGGRRQASLQEFVTNA